jgi:hypothetical protein
MEAIAGAVLKEESDEKSGSVKEGCYNRGDEEKEDECPATRCSWHHREI